MKKPLAALLAAATLLYAMGTAALAETDASASPEASASATHSDGAAADTAGIVIQLGDEGDNVILLQLRLADLGYYNYKITGFFGDFTKSALADFQSTNGIDSDGIAGAQTLNALYNNDAKRKPVEPLTIKTTVKKTSSPRYGAIIEWSQANKMWRIGAKCKVTDLNTGISYNMIRVNQSYSVGHADVAPATKSDTAALKKTFSGSLSAYRRALTVVINGERYAASIYAEPHGSTGVKGNGMNKPDGTLQQVCIHFKGSWTNGRGLVDSAHQYQILRAAKKKPTMSRSALVYPGD